MKKRSRRGFTLIELLVVISIIAVLAAIIMPIYKRVQEQGNQADCISHLHAIGIATRNYHADFHKFPGPVVQPSAEPPGVTTGGMYDLYIGKYISNWKALICIDDSSSLAAGTQEWGTPAAIYSTYNVDSDLVSQVYNYWGLDTSGHAYPTQADVQAPPAPPSGKPPYPILGDSEYPALRNSNAPDDTIITHCTRHRTATGATALDIVLRLGGDARREPSGQVHWMVWY
jgi:prepilin-type N-terminal cleavage/methylation domain-containing protein